MLALVLALVFGVRFWRFKTYYTGVGTAGTAGTAGTSAWNYLLEAGDREA